jgi:flagellar biosynthesis/type III secretory pathway protein FliH
MPGPGQGKRSNKKKWHENASNLNASIAAVNTVMMASNTATPNTSLATSELLPPNDATTTAPPANETALNARPFTPTQSTAVTTMTTSADAATNNTNDETHWHVDTAASSINDETSQTLPFTYSHEEVQQLLEDARLDGWQAGFEEGHKTGRKTGKEEGKEEGYNEGHTEGYECGYDVRRRLGEQREDGARKGGRLEGYEAGMREGYEVGLKKGEENGKEHERQKFFFFFLNQQFIMRCSIAVRGKPYKTEYSLRVYTCKIGRDATALTSPFRAVMSPARAKRGQENNKEYWALRRLPKPALAPDGHPPQHTQSTPKDVPSRGRTRV